MIGSVGVVLANASTKNHSSEALAIVLIVLLSMLCGVVLSVAWVLLCKIWRGK